MDEQIFLNVGGVYFASRRSTLLSSESFFAGAVRAQPDCCEMFVDRDPTFFRHVLNWLRGVRYLPEDDATLRELLWEADYFCMPDMADAIRNAKTRSISMHKVMADIHHDIRLLRR